MMNTTEVKPKNYLGENHWIAFPFLGGIIKRISESIENKEYIWFKHPRFKYIGLRIDTRNGVFLILKLNGDIIPQTDLKGIFAESKEAAPRTVTIEGSAIKFNDIIYSLPRPYRHQHVRRATVALRGSGIDGPHTDGFVDSTGVFQTREQAYFTACVAGQLISGEQYVVGKSLYSEDIWDEADEKNVLPQTLRLLKVQLDSTLSDKTDVEILNSIIDGDNNGV